MGKFAAFFVLFVTGIVAFASGVAEPGTIEEAIPFLVMLVDAVKSGSWVIAGSIVSVLGIAYLRAKVLPSYIGKAWYTVAALVLGAVSGALLEMVMGAGVDVAGKALLTALTTPVMYDAILKYFLPKKA